jgi:hypothetical protein
VKGEVDLKLILHRDSVPEVEWKAQFPLIG